MSASAFKVFFFFPSQQGAPTAVASRHSLHTTQLHLTNLPMLHQLQAMVTCYPLAATTVRPKEPLPMISLNTHTHAQLMKPNRMPTAMEVSTVLMHMGRLVISRAVVTAAPITTEATRISRFWLSGAQQEICDL